jgi:hypothetical protein
MCVQIHGVFRGALKNIGLFNLNRYELTIASRGTLRRQAGSAPLKLNVGRHKL